MQEQNLPTQSPQLSQEIITAQFRKELMAYQYQQILDDLGAIIVTSDNIDLVQEKIKKARSLQKELEGIKARIKSPYWEICKKYDFSFNSLNLPLNNLIIDKEKRVNEVSRKKVEENQRKEREIERIDRIKKSIEEFVFEQTRNIASATTDIELIAIEKLIGSHKANKSRYEELLPSLVEKCEELTPLIKKQKEHIRELAEIERKKNEALKNGDDREAMELEEKKEAVQSSIEETKIIIQETAIESALSSTDVIEVKEILVTPKPRRTTWEMEIVDEKKAFNSGMLICEINKEKAKAQLEVVKQTLPKDQEEMTINGIRYYQNKIY